MKRMDAKEFFRVTIYKIVIAAILFLIMDIIGIFIMRCTGCLLGAVDCVVRDLDGFPLFDDYETAVKDLTEHRGCDEETRKPMASSIKIYKLL